jgi:hypothetical protein
MGSRFAAIAATVVVVLISTAPATLADGDPASDVLLGQNVFYPYNPATSTALQRSLNDATAAAGKAHFPIKVALIAEPVDLGVIPELFGKPQQYAKFLDQEISFTGKQLLLVVMKAGYGVEGLPAASTAEAPKLTAPAGGTSDALAQAAVAAVAKLAAADGHHLTVTTTQSSPGPSNTKTVLLIALVLAAVATAGALVVVRRRSEPT